jgi:invasion protein IalB
VAVYNAECKPAQKIVRILMSLAFLVLSGIRIAVDKNQPVAGRYAICLPHGCFAEATLNDDFVAAIMKDATMNMSARNQVG